MKAVHQTELHVPVGVVLYFVHIPDADSGNTPSSEPLSRTLGNPFAFRHFSMRRCGSIVQIPQRTTDETPEPTLPPLPQSYLFRTPPQPQVRNMPLVLVMRSGGLIYPFHHIIAMTTHHCPLRRGTGTPCGQSRKQFGVTFCPTHEEVCPIHLCAFPNTEACKSCTVRFASRLAEFT